MPLAHCIHNNLVSDDDKRHLQGINPDMMLDCSLPPGQPPNPLDGCRQLVELKTISQRNAPVEERAVKIQRGVVQHAKLMSHGTGGQYVALVVGRFGEFSKDFIKLRDYIARQRAYAYVEHFNSSITGAMSMFKLSITSRWSLMAARGWARLILDRRRDLVDDRPSRAAAAAAPLDEAQERHYFDNPTSHSRGAFYHGEAE